MDSKACELLIIGAGAAGLMAAGIASGLGVRTLVAEKMDRPARKLLITGKGRCNLTNTDNLDAFLGHFDRPGALLLRHALRRFCNEDLRAFFHALNVPTVVERGGRVFPVEGGARQITQALVDWARRQGAEIRLQAAVTGLMAREGRIQAALVGRQGAQGRAPQAPLLEARAFVLAAGGASYPATGSTGDSYRLAQAVGHTIIPIRPALVPLETAGDTAMRLTGLSLRNVTLKVLANGRPIAEAFGEMLFTHFGVSGPLVLTVSRRAVDALAQGQAVVLSIDLKPALDTPQLEARLQRDLDRHGKARLASVLKGLLPRSLIAVALEMARLDPSRPAHQTTGAERRRLATWLKDFRLTVTGHRSFAEAVTTAGGVAGREVVPQTLASRRWGNLFLAGEVLDIDADTGGYNLQAAFSTGWVAGHSAARYVLAERAGG